MSEALSHARAPTEKAELYALRMIGATTRADWSGSLRPGFRALAELGYPIAED